MTIAVLTVKSEKNDTLSSLYREIDAKFPNLDQIVNSFTIVEGKKNFSAVGEPVVKEIEIIWNIQDPDSETQKVMQQVIEIIQSSGQGDLKIVYDA